MITLAKFVSAAAKGAKSAFIGEMPSSLVNWRLARFADSDLERGHQQYLVDVELPKERLVNYLGILIYYAFGLLDIMTFKEDLGFILLLRWGICGPIALAAVSMSFHRKFRRYFKLGTATVMLTGALSVIVMIALAPAGEAPPYIIGIFAIFILFACIQRIWFPVAAVIYVATFALWALVVTVIAPKTSVEIISGLFFFTWTTIVALATTYSQEIRSRLVFYQNKCREEDSQSIQKLLIEATAADQSKINFLSILSHELRTPLHQIIGFSEVIQQNPEKRNLQFLDQINTSAQQLLSRISKMLRYADATAGKITYDLERCDLKEIIGVAAEQVTAKHARQNVKIELGDFGDPQLRLDASHTIYALSNLIENAVVASTTGQSVLIAGQWIGEGDYQLVIVDCGVGMSKEQIDSAFKPFSIAEDVRTRSIEGVGLGLTLARKIFEDQGAQITLNSKIGTGTSVYVVFRRAKASDSAAA